MDNRFADKVVLLAGGTGALGQAISLAFLAVLGKVVVTYRQPEEFAALQKAAPAHSAQSQTADSAATYSQTATKPAPSLPKPVDPMVVLHTSQGDVTI